jgi:hypothetical protein
MACAVLERKANAVWNKKPQKRRVYINATPRTCPNGEGEGATSFMRMFFFYL